MASRRNANDFEAARPRKTTYTKNRQDSASAATFNHYSGSTAASNSFSGYKMEIPRPVLDYMCYLEQHIEDTKRECQRESDIVSGVILNMARLFGLDNVTQASIDEFLRTTVIAGKEPEIESLLQRPDWFEMLQEKRMESYLSEKTKEPQKKNLSPITYRDNHSSDDFTIPKRKYTKRVQELDIEPRKKRKYESRQPKPEFAAATQLPQLVPDYNEGGHAATTSNVYTTLLANILEQNGSNVNMEMIGGFEKYINPDLKLTAADNKKLN